MVTTLGWLGVAVTSAVLSFSSGIWDPDEVGSFLNRPPMARLMSNLILGAVMGTVFGVLFGLFQWKALRRTRRYATITVVVTMIGTAFLCAMSSTGPVQVQGDLAILRRSVLTGGILGGTFCGLCQWLLLIRRLPGVDRWPLITTIGWAGGWAILLWCLDIRLDGSFTSNPILLAVIPPAAGVIAGLPQWLLLRRRLQRAGWWILATAVGWALPFWFIQISSSRMVYGLLLVGIIPATAIVFLLRQLEPDAPSESTGK